MNVQTTAGDTGGISLQCKALRQYEVDARLVALGDVTWRLVHFNYLVSTKKDNDDPEWHRH